MHRLPAVLAVLSVFEALDWFVLIFQVPDCWLLQHFVPVKAVVSNYQVVDVMLLFAVTDFEVHLFSPATH